MAPFRTPDGRFIETRFVVSDETRKAILGCKRGGGFTWAELARIAGLSSYTLSHEYLKSGLTIPSSVIRRMSKIPGFTLRKDGLEKIDPFWGQRKNRLFKDFTHPDITSTDYAEFIGAMLGDGCVYSNLTGFCITGNSHTDKEYFHYLSGLINRLFGLNPKIYYSRSDKAVRCVVYSRKLVEFVVDSGMPVGEKKEHYTGINKIYFKDKKLLKALVRGIMDTDGSIYPHPSSDVIVDISIKNKRLLDDVVHIFGVLDFPESHTKDRIYFIGKKRVLSYFRFFGSSNMKHVTKLIELEKGNKVPTTAQLDGFNNNTSNVRLPYYGPVV